ncbi:MAG: KOW domain-containing RNA-binding protein [Clostridiales bacterium]|nr:KOW domain-containing RNA-binding protein [Clostridiales bacterium]
MASIHPNEIVLSLAGRDRGQLFFVVKEEGDFVLLVNGKGRKLAAPKRKRKKHVQGVGTSAHPAAQRLHRGEAVSDRQLRAALAAFRNSEFPVWPEQGHPLKEEINSCPKTI